MRDSHPFLHAAQRTLVIEFGRRKFRGPAWAVLLAFAMFLLAVAGTITAIGADGVLTKVDAQPAAIANHRRRLPVKQLGKAPRRVRLHAWQDVRVEVERHFDALVTQPPLDDVRLLTRRQHQSCAGVAQAVDREAFDPRTFAEARQQFTDAGLVQRASQQGASAIRVLPVLREHESVVGIVEAVLQLGLGLIAPVFTQQRDRFIA